MNHKNNKMLPTIKNICSQQNQMHYGNYQENGLILKHKITSVKINNLVRVFATKVKRNITSSKPIDFQIVNQDKEHRWVNWKGFDIEDRFQGFILIMDIFMSIVMLYIATFQGLIDDFLLSDSVSDAVIILKAFAIFFFSVRMIMIFVTIDYIDDYFYVYITDIIRKYLTEARLIMWVLIYLFELVMTILSVAIPNSSQVGIILLFAIFLKLVTSTKSIRQLEQLFFSSSRSYYIWNLIKLIIFNILFGHLLACIFLAIAKINPDQNWIHLKLINNNLIDTQLTWYKLYIWGYYWATTVATTIGFGDITPVDFREAIVVALVEVFGTMMMAYNISEVGNIISSIRKPNIILDRKLAVIRRMNKQNNISDELSGKIQSYLSHQLQIKQSFQYQEHRQIMSQIPEQLRQQYYQQANRITYSQLPFFRDLQSTTKIALAQSFNGKVYYPKQYIVKCRHPISEIVIMRKGSFSLCFWKSNSQMNGTVVETISNQQNGIPYLVTTNILSRDIPLSFDVIAENYSYALVLPLQQFKQIIKKSKIDYSYYHNILDMHQKDPNPYDYVKCSYCKDQWHTKFDCTKLHYIPLESQIMYQELKKQSRNVERSIFDRKIINHRYFSLQKDLYKQLQRQIESIALIQEQDEQEAQYSMNVDVAENFSHYFQNCNSQKLKMIPLGRQKRRLSKFGKTVLRSLKRMGNSNQIMDNDRLVSMQNKNTL